MVRDGETGLLLEQKDDAQELAEKILDLLRRQERRRRLGQQGREWVLGHFSWEQIAGDLEQVYAEVLKQEDCVRPSCTPSRKQLRQGASYAPRIYATRGACSRLTGRDHFEGPAGAAAAGRPPWAGLPGWIASSRVRT